MQVCIRTAFHVAQEVNPGAATRNLKITYLSLNDLFMTHLKPVLRSDSEFKYASIEIHTRGRSYTTHIILILYHLKQSLLP